MTAYTLSVAPPDKHTRALILANLKKRKNGFHEKKVNPGRIGCTTMGSAADSHQIRLFLTKTILTLSFSEFVSGGRVLHLKGNGLKQNVIGKGKQIRWNAQQKE
jgi:hypothetical protein